MAVDASVRIAFLPGVDPAQNGTSFGSALGEEGGVLVVDYTGNFAGTISQFAPGDRLVFPGLTSLSVSNLTANSFQVSGYDSGGVLQSFTINALMPAGTTPAVETDLGEYLLQLAGQHPTHIIAPAMELTKERCAELLSAVDGVPIEPEHSALMAAARRQLREAFLAADVGITGANFAVAETGSIVLVTNEGNGRLVT
ncbi:MAG TPA: LUD domain-containing protein, partial [Acetobacteraceae bacterium]|nr:LUD domain-containing protein [Acetobacteraceae bacterium]